MYFSWEEPFIVLEVDFTGMVSGLRRLQYRGCLQGCGEPPGPEAVPHAGPSGQGLHYPSPECLGEREKGIGRALCGEGILMTLMMDPANSW